MPHRHNGWLGDANTAWTCWCHWAAFRVGDHLAFTLWLPLSVGLHVNDEIKQVFKKSVHWHHKEKTMTYYLLDHTHLHPLTKYDFSITFNTKRKDQRWSRDNMGGDQKVTTDGSLNTFWLFLHVFWWWGGVNRNSCRLPSYPTSSSFPPDTEEEKALKETGKRRKATEEHKAHLCRHFLFP